MTEEMTCSEMHLACTAADTPPWGDVNMGLQANLDFITKLHLLQTLILARTHVGCYNLDFLGKLNQLRHLDVSHTMLANGDLLAAKEALAGLEHFDVSYTHLVSPREGLFGMQALSMQALNTHGLACHEVPCRSAACCL